MPDEVIQAAAEGTPSADTQPTADPAATEQQETETAAQEQQTTEPAKAAAEEKPAAAAVTAEKAEATAEPADTAEQLAALQGENYALKHGVSAEKAADVVTLARAQVNDKITLEQAIEGVIAKYPHYFKADGSVKISVAGATNNDVASALSDDTRERSIMGLPPRK